MKVYMLIYRDKYELPVAVADTIKELALISGLSDKHCYSLLKKPTRFYYVEIVSL